MSVIQRIRRLREGPLPPPGARTLQIRVVDEPPALIVGAVGEDPPLRAARAADVLHLPRMGAVVGAEGALFRWPAAEVLQYDPALASFPYFRTAGETMSFNPPAQTERRSRASVWLPFHATYNYGHFLLDALPSLLAADELGLLADFEPVSPPLKPWQRALLRLAFGDEVTIHETSAAVVRLDEAVWFSSLDQFLHAPNAILARLRLRMLERAPPAPADAPRRLYLSRRDWSMRVMLNEPELEAALQSRGFTVVRPETLSVPEQAALMRSAEVIVGPTGAGLANAFFAPLEARVIEIQPENFGGAWVRLFRQVTGGEASVFVCPSPAPLAEVPLRRRLRLGFAFAYRAPLAELLAHVDARLGPSTPS